MTGLAFDPTTPSTQWLGENLDRQQIQAITQFLIDQGTFHFPALPNGLFSAAASQAEDFAITGYQHVWVRDNMQIAHAHQVIGERAAARRTCAAVLEFYIKHQHRFDDLLTGKSDPQEPMQRPHIRFDGRNLAELTENWSHAQNDALGYFLWLTCSLIEADLVNREPNGMFPTSAGWTVLCDLVHFWNLVKFWEDEDSGHWEEIRKVAASSIGCATAGLTALRGLMEHPVVTTAVAHATRPVDKQLLDKLIAKGQSALVTILPYECRQTNPKQQRRYDAALLFLLYPLEIVEPAMESQILEDVNGHLMGDYGVRRYLGDSYWCADYKNLLSAESRTADVSDDMSARDSLLKPGQEAQWCIFDPIISVVHGRRYLRTKEPQELVSQKSHLQRSLSQLTPPGSPFGAYRCPESYYLEGGKYGPNDLTPLLWTQANLRLALHHMERSL